MVDVDYPRLCRSVGHSRRALQFFRDRRLDRVALYAGGDYSAETSDCPRPVNLIALFVNIYGRSLVAKNPRVMLSTFDRAHKPAVRAMQDWANHEIVRTDLASTLQRAVVDAIFQVGVVKVGIATPADAAAAAWSLKAGDPYAACVSLDDLVYDVFARHRSEFAYVGNFGRYPIDAVKDSKLYGPGRRKLEPSEKRQHNEDGGDRADTLSGWATVGTREEAEDHVSLLTLYLPRRRRVVTFACDETGSPVEDMDPLRDVEWVGPDRGPYCWFTFGPVPDSPMPKGALSDLVDLDLDANDAWRKLSRQAERYKHLGLVQSTNTEDGKAIREARDGEIVPVSAMGTFQEAKTGGPSPELLAFFNVTRDAFNFFAGGLQAVGGLGASAKTATAEKLISESAQSGVADMQAEAIRGTAEVIESLLWYYWHSPFKVMRTEYKRPGMDPVPRALYPAGALDARTRRPKPLRRDARFEDLNLKVDPYSVQFSTPQQRAQALTGVFTQLLAPALGLLQQQGVGVDMQKFLSQLGEYMDMPDLADILNLAEPPDRGPQARGGAGQDGAGMPAQTERTYTRQSVPQDTEATRRQEAVESLAAAGAERNGKAGGY